jgi:hypothetical protein
MEVFNQTGSHRIIQHIQNHFLHTFFPPDGMIVVAALPDRALAVQSLVDLDGGEILESPHQVGQRSPLQLGYKMNMIRHYHGSVK